HEVAGQPSDKRRRARLFSQDRRVFSHAFPTGSVRDRHPAWQARRSIGRPDGCKNTTFDEDFLATHNLDKSGKWLSPAFMASIPNGKKGHGQMNVLETKNRLSQVIKA